MDNSLLFVIGALVLGLIIGWIIRGAQAGGRITELEGQMRSVQGAADSAKRDVTNAQSELNVKQSYIGTLTSTVGILEEKLRRAEQGGGETTALVAKLQDDLRAATADRPAFESELRQRDLDLSDLRAQIETLKDERDAAIASAADLQARLDAEPQPANLMATSADAMQPGQVDHDGDGTAIDTDGSVAQLGEDGDNSDTAALEKLEEEQPEASLAPDASAQQGVQQELTTLRNSLVTLAFSGAALARALDKRNKDYDDLLVRYSGLNIASLRPDDVDASEAQTAAVAQPAPDRPNGADAHTQPATLAMADPESTITHDAADVQPNEVDLHAAEFADPERQATLIASDVDAAPPVRPTESSAADVELAQTKAQLAALQADLQTALDGKGEMAAQLQARDNELYDVTAQLASLKDDLHTATADKDKVAVELQAREAELAELRASVEDIRAQKEEADQTLNAKVTEIGTLTAAATSAADALKKKEASIADLESKLATMDARMAEMTAELEAAKANQVNTSNKPVLGPALAGIGGAVVGSAVSNAGANDDLTKANARIAELEQQLEASGGREGPAPAMTLAATPVVDRSGAVSAQGAQDGQDGQDEVIADLTARLDATKNVLNARGLEADDAHAQQSLLQSRDVELGDLKSRFATLDAEHRTLVDEYRTLGSIRGDVQTQLYAKSSYVESLQAELARMREAHEQDIAAKVSDIGVLTAGAATAAATLKLRDDALAAANGELETLHAQFDELTAANSKLATMRTELDDALTAKASAEAMLQDKELAITDAHAKLASLQADLDKAVSEAAELHSGLNNRNAEYDALNTKLGDLRTQLDAALSEKANQQNTLAAQETQLNDLRAEVQRVKDEGDQSLASQVAKVGALTAAGVAAAASIKGKEEEVAAANARIAELEAKLNEETSARTTLAATFDERTANFDALNAQIPTLNDQLASLTAERDEAVTRAQSLTVTVDEEAAQIEALNANVKALMTERDDALARAQSLEASMGERTTNIESLNAQITSLNEQIAGLSGERDQALTQISALQADLNGRATEFESLGAQVATLTGEREAALTRVNDFDALNARVESLIGQLTEMTDERDNVNAQLTSVTGERDAFNSRVTELTSARDETDARLGGLMGERDADQARIGTLEASLAESTGNLDVLTAQIASLREEMTGLAAERDTAQAQLAALNDQVAALTSERDAAQAGLQARDADLSDATSRLAALQAELDNARAEPRQPASVAMPAQVETDAGAAAADAEPEDDANDGEGTAVMNRLVADGTRLADSPTKAAAAQAAVNAGGNVTLSACPQDLSDVNSIGSVFEQRLYAAGVGTYWELANLSDDDMVRILQLNDRQRMRLDFDAVRDDATRLAQASDSVGRLWEGTEPDNFEPLEGIGPVYEKRLYDAGICTFSALADLSTEELMRICPPTKIRTPNYEEWLTQARELALRAKS